jgi:hypothetical protein
VYSRSVRVFAIVLTVAACNYSPSPVQNTATDGQPEGDGPEGDGPGDAPPDSFVGPPPSACVTRWLTGDLDFSNPAFLPQNLGILATTVRERDPFLSSDELMIFFTRPGSGGDSDIVFAERPSIGAPFGGTGAATSLNDNTGNESKVTMTANDLTGIVASGRGGGEGGVDFWQATRGAAGDQAFPALNQDFLGEINDAGDQQDPFLSGDGLRLYLSSGSPQKLLVAARASLTASFGTAVEIANIGSATGDADPTLSGDERVIVFTSNRGGGDGSTDLWYATRPERDQPFTTPINLGQVNGSDADGDAHLSADGCRLYFSSDRQATATDDFDVFFTQLQ